MPLVPAIEPSEATVHVKHPDGSTVTFTGHIYRFEFDGVTSPTLNLGWVPGVKIEHQEPPS